MSRNEAKKRFSLEDHAKATEGVECRKDKDVIDETPAAYKVDNHRIIFNEPSNRILTKSLKHSEILSKLYIH